MEGTSQEEGLAATSRPHRTRLKFLDIPIFLDLKA